MLAFIRAVQLNVFFMISRHLLPILLGLVVLGLTEEGRADDNQSRLSVVIPSVDAQKGRLLFVNKGCVICHSVAGVGGKAAPALDAKPGVQSIELLGFASRMWRGSWAMTELQSIELGYWIELSAQEIADLAAFAADSKAQEGFSLQDVPEPLQDWTLDEPYWENDDWPEYLYQQGPIFNEQRP